MQKYEPSFDSNNLLCTFHRNSPRDYFFMREKPQNSTVSGENDPREEIKSLRKAVHSHQTQNEFLLADMKHLEDEYNLKLSIQESSYR